jgi:hypothetical protein
LEWSTVILATCVETYLQDVLVFCAGLDSKLMGDARQTATYEEITAARSTEELAEQMRAKWARNWVDDGGPARWVDRLKRMGARGYTESLPGLLEVLWGMRHVVVHRAGRITPDFVRRHPQLGVAAGERFNLRDELPPYFNGVIEFVRITDEFFVQRYRVGE